MGEARRALVVTAAEAHTNLTVFHAIIALCESGCFYGYQPELAAIVATARRGADRCLREHDKTLQALKDTDHAQ